jgi:Heat induced stress protein YflT
LVKTKNQNICFPFSISSPISVNPATIKENMPQVFPFIRDLALGILFLRLKRGGILLISATKPFVKFHKYDAELASDVHALNSAGYNSDDIWVLKWNPDKNHSNQRNNFYKYSTHFESAVGHIDSMAHFFDNGGKELRQRLEKLGLTKDECSALVRELQETDYTCLLVVRDLKDNIIKMND